MSDDEVILQKHSTHHLLKEALGLEGEAQPFPWQLRLIDRLLEGKPPRSIDIPTGLGKTAVMAIWLVARICGAPVPRRLVYVVDRRAVVDQATEVAKQLRKWLSRRPELREALGLGERDLPISTLRGQFADNKEWLDDPTSPAIIVGTVDMIGSRLLFQGYVVSRKMRPYHAGLIGSDAWIILDEAHLVVPFERLVEDIQNNESLKPHPKRMSRDLIPPFRMTALSATGRPHEGECFKLDEVDLDSPVVNHRLKASKAIIKHPIGDKKELAETLAMHAWDLGQANTTPQQILVYCNRRIDAEKVKSEIEKLVKAEKEISASPPVLFVGARRVREREEAWKWLKEHGFIASDSGPPDKTQFLIATSAAEVGVDLDADHMVCDVAPWERMIQRFGRVNRVGRTESTIILVTEPESSAKNANEFRKQQEATLQLLEHLPVKTTGLDCSPNALLTVQEEANTNSDLRQLIDAATTPVPLRPALTRPLLDAWSLTSLKEHTGRPDIRPWLRGWIDDDQPQTRIIWRKHLPARSMGQDRLNVSFREVEAFFEAAPPYLSEILETETWKVMEWLVKRSGSLRKTRSKTNSHDFEGILDDEPENKISESIPRDDDVIVYVLSPAGDLRSTIKFYELDSDSSKKDQKAFADQKELEGATIVVDARVAGLRDGLLENTENRPPTTVDLCDEADPWEDKETTPPQIPFRIIVGGVNFETSNREKEWRERLQFPTMVSSEGETLEMMIIQKWGSDASTEDDRSSSRPQLLDEHESWAEERARMLGSRLGLPEEYVEMLGIAAALHDEGKRATRWQRAFNAPAGGDYAKTKGPINQNILCGYRHEFGSLLHVKNNSRLSELPPDFRELALHLITAHHGFARPLISSQGCDETPPSKLEEKVQEAALRYVRLQREWGPWGLAWWETLLRAADQQASKDNDARGGA